MKKQLLTIALALFATVSFSQTDSWIDYAADSYAGGTGTEDDPYLIATPEQLAKLSADTYGSEAVLTQEMEANDVYEAFDGVYFRLTADIDLAGHQWMGIGGWSDPDNPEATPDVYKFMGVFDGDGKSVSNMNGYFGLFGTTGLFAEIRNVTVASGTVTANAMSAFAGGIVGDNRGLVENCVNHASVSSLFFYPGGIAGCNSRGEDGSLSGTIRRCVNYGTVSSQPGSMNGMYSGGIVGSNNSIIEECANYGNISAVTGAAGIAAAVEIGTIKNCYNRGTVTVSSEQAAGITVGLLGRTGECILSTCYNTGKITSPAGLASGAVTIFGMPGPCSADNIYNDSQACPGMPVCESVAMADVDESTTLDMTTAEMKSQAFADLLNAAGETDQWVYDPSANEGYPTFKWFIEAGLSNVESVVADALAEVSVYGLDGQIYVKGVENAHVAVFDMSGMLLTEGDMAAVSAKTFDGGLYIVSVRADGAIKNVKVAL